MEHLIPLFELHADPAVWVHKPKARHLSPERTAEDIDMYANHWPTAGLGYWAVREKATDVVVGIAGVSRHEPGFWNMYYRFAPQVQGRGFALEAGRAALAAASERAPDEPVIASLLQRNVASRRLAEKLGLQLVWEGPDRENSADTRQILADRSLPEAILERWAQ